MNQVERPEIIFSKTQAFMERQYNQLENPTKPYSWSEWDGYQQDQSWRNRTSMSPYVESLKRDASRDTTNLTRRVERFLRTT